MNSYFQFSVFAIGILVVIFAIGMYRRYADAFHPMVVLSPLLFLGYAVWPFLLNYDGELERLLGADNMAYFGTYYFFALLGLCLGLTVKVPRRVWDKRAENPWKALMGTVRGEHARRRLLVLAVVMAVISNAVYWWGISNAGGLGEAYAKYKGGGQLNASGWVTEMVILCYPSAILYAFTRRSRKVTVGAVCVLLLILAPNLLQGTLGVRRGPLFLTLCTMFLCIVVVRGRPPKVAFTTLAISAIVLVVVVVWAQRRMWFESGEVTLNPAVVVATVVGRTDQLGTNDYVAGIGSAMTTRKFDAYFWGKRWAVDLFVRPIPRQIWANKYEDVGAYWKLEAGNPAGHDEMDQVEALGFPLPRGHSIGFLSDLYTEWNWAGAVACFFFGLFLRFLWIRHRLRGQVWSVIMLIGYALAIYLPTQSFSAWYHRFLLMTFLTGFLWRRVVGEDVRVIKAVEKRPKAARDRELR